MIAAGTACNHRYPGASRPYDPFRGARHAIIEDRDRNPVGSCTRSMLSPGTSRPPRPRPGRHGAALPPDQPDLHEQAENHELQLPYQISQARQRTAITLRRLLNSYGLRSRRTAATAYARSVPG